MKKFIIINILWVFFCNNIAFASNYILQTQKYDLIQTETKVEEENEKNNDILNDDAKDEDVLNVETDFQKISPSEYKQKTVKKLYDVYNVQVTNKSKKPILLSSDSEVYFILSNNSTIKSENRRTIYRKTRKKDIGKFYSFSLLGAIISGGITGITFFIGSPIAAAIYVGMNLPADRAVRANVKISQDLFNSKSLPIKFEKDETYNLLFFVPKGLPVKEIMISNVSFDFENMFDLKIKAETR